MSAHEEAVGRVLEGRTVVANIRTQPDLINWAVTWGRYQRIDRATPWGNQYRIGVHGNRDGVILAYAEHLARQLSAGVVRNLLSGKVLGCWCAPQPCHGDVLAAIANGADPRQVAVSLKARQRTDPDTPITLPGL